MSSIRQWRIDWAVPDHSTVGALRGVVEGLRGYGVAVLTDDLGLPKAVAVTFETTPDFTEFDLADALRDIAVTYAWHQGFPERPTEVLEEAS